MPKGSPPVIGIATSVLLDQDKPRLMNPARYGDAIRRAGGTSVLVGGNSTDPSEVAAQLDRIDGLLLPGGYDFDTERLGLGPVHPKARIVPSVQQDRDLQFAAQALTRAMPVLGICYGMQLLGLHGGGTLHQHLPDDAPGKVEHFAEVHKGYLRHDVVLDPSLLYAMIGGEPLEVISGHHQALASVGQGWRVSATDDDGLIEAIERPDLPFAIGVQWHPEVEQPGTRHDAIFNGLVAASRAHANEIATAQSVAS